MRLTREQPAKTEEVEKIGGALSPLFVFISERGHPFYDNRP
jgi:hypothetical protein